MTASGSSSSWGIDMKYKVYYTLRGFVPTFCDTVEADDSEDESLREALAEIVNETFRDKMDEDHPAPLVNRILAVVQAD